MKRTRRTVRSPLSKKLVMSMWVSATPRPPGSAMMMTSPTEREAWGILSLMSKILALMSMKQVTFHRYIVLFSYSSKSFKGCSKLRTTLTTLIRKNLQPSCKILNLVSFSIPCISKYPVTSGVAKYIKYIDVQVSSQISFIIFDTTEWDQPLCFLYGWTDKCSSYLYYELWILLSAKKNLYKGSHDT